MAEGHHSQSSHMEWTYVGMQEKMTHPLLWAELLQNKAFIAKREQDDRKQLEFFMDCLQYLQIYQGFHL